jgi:hypothetical protein
MQHSSCMLTANLCVHSVARRWRGQQHTHGIGEAAPVCQGLGQEEPMCDASNAQVRGAAREPANSLLVSQNWEPSTPADNSPVLGLQEMGCHGTQGVHMTVVITTAQPITPGPLQKSASAARWWRECQE